MASFQYSTALTHQRPHALFQSQVGAFFDAVFWPLGSSAKSTEHGCIAPQIDCIIAPVSGGGHPAVKIEYLGEFVPVEPGLTQPVGRRKRGYGRAQALLLPLAVLRGSDVSADVPSRSAISSPSFLRIVSTSH